MKFVHVSVKESNGRWKRIPNGPYPITAEQLDEARREFAAELAVCPPLSGCRVSPQTAARDILSKIAPHLDTLDKGMLGFAVTCSKYRIEKDDA